MTQRWICLQCHRVVVAKSFACCGAVEPFDPTRHGDLLVSHSNAWIAVWSRWRDHPMLRATSQRLNKRRSHGAATHLNEWIRAMTEAGERMTWTRDVPTEPGWYAVHTLSAAGMFAAHVEADVDTGELWARDWEHDWFRIVEDAGWLWCKLEVPKLSLEVSV